MTATDVKSIPESLETLKKAAARRRKAQVEWDASQEQFLAAAAQARRSGARVVSIATAAGISRQRAHSIIKGVRPVDAS